MAAIFSFSKLFPSVLGGALVSGDAALIDFARRRFIDHSRIASHVSYVSRFLYDRFRSTRLERSLARVQEMAYGIADAGLAIAPTSMRIVAEAIRAGAIEARRANYRHLLEHFGDQPDYFAGLEREDVTPYVAPLFAPERVLEKLVTALRAEGVATGLYHFDINRNVFNPRFVKALWVPVHQGLGEHDLDRICHLIRRAAP